jgi:tRNA(Ile)-lysidine synthase
VEVVVRPWRAGDRVAPLGLGGTKTVGDLFTARRVPREERATIPIVEVAGEIAWIPGVATGERFRVTGATRAALRFDAHR